MKSPTLLFVLLFPFSMLNAQNAEIDSLQILLPSLLPDTNRVIVLNRLAKKIRHSAPKKSIEHCKEALHLADSLHYMNGIIDANYEWGAALNISAKISPGASKKAILHLEKSIDDAKKANQLGLVARGYSTLANSGIPLKEQLDVLEEAITYSKRAKDDKRLIRAMYKLAIVYYDEKDFREGIDLLEEAIKKAEAIHYTGLLPQLYSVACGYIHAFNSEENYLLAEVYGDKALAMTDKIDNPYDWAMYANNLSLVKGKLKKLKEAIFLIDEAQRIYNELDITDYHAIAGKKGEIYFHNNLPEKAIPFFLESLKHPALGEHEADLRNLANSYAQIQDFEQAYFYADSVRKYNQKIYIEKSSEKLAAFNAKFQATEKEAKIAQQQLELAQGKTAQNQTIFGGILALLFLSGVYFWYYQTQKQKNLAAESALQLEQTKANSLEKLDALKSKFFTNISHELRTPLTLISGPIENAMGQAKTPSVRNDLKLAHSNSKKLLNLVNEILDLSKLESGKLQINESVVNFDQLLRRIFFSFSSLAEIRDVELVYQNDIDKRFCFKMDIEKIEKICNNLLSNAIKYTPSGGMVSLSSEMINGRLSLSISDTGKGIHADDLSKVFDRFYQSSQQNEPLQGGTGVGLALARELSRLFGGELSVASTLGKGSVFNLNIPVKRAKNLMQIVEIKEAKKEKATKTHYAPVLIDNQKPKLLIIEDNSEMSQYLISLLASEYNCSTAMNGKQGLDMLQKQSFDLVTCDVMMPEMDGFELRQKINEDQNQRYTPFIFLTARVLEEDKIKGLQLGVDDYIAKPFSKTELLVRIHNLLSNKAERDLWQKENKREEEDVPETAEAQLLRQAEEIVLKNLDNVQFKVNDLAIAISYNQRSLSRIIKKTTGLSTVNFILEIRLQKARQLLEQRRFLTVNEVRYEIGIDSASYFTTKFTARFGRNPKAYLGD